MAGHRVRQRGRVHHQGRRYFSITIIDPAADSRRFEDAFRAVGVNATVKMVPAMPDHVGKLYGPALPTGAIPAGAET